MTKEEFDRKQNEKLMELAAGSDPKTMYEKDLYNLKYLRYSIRFGDKRFRMGCISTLDRAIAILEEDINSLNAENTSPLSSFDGWDGGGGF